MNVRNIWVLIICVTLLVTIGIIMVMSSSWALSYLQNDGDSFYFFKRHLINVVVGIVTLAFFAFLNPKWLKRFAYFAVGGSVVLLVAVLFVGVGGYAAPVKRWISVGGFFIQPSEFAKLGLLVFLARALAERKDFSDYRELIVPASAVGITVVLIVLQPDVSMAMLILATAGILFFFAGIRWRYILGAAGLSLPAIAIVIYMAQYRIWRLVTFLDPWRYSRGKGYQVIQSLIALGSGGIVGKGPGGSFQKLFYLPQPHTDFIYSILGEEFGLLGTASVVILFAILITIGFRIGRRVQDRFSSYLVLGGVSLLAMEAAINMGVCTSLLPTTGIPLPFISYGGSSMVVSMAIIGITISVARRKGAESQPVAEAVERYSDVDVFDVGYTGFSEWPQEY
ncbi:MAG: putative lipid II flippase FtsW [bacterium]|nr:putative lipid II flippase FtsW [bacterium]